VAGLNQTSEAWLTVHLSKQQGRFAFVDNQPGDTGPGAAAEVLVLDMHRSVSCDVNRPAPKSSAHECVSGRCGIRLARRALSPRPTTNSINYCSVHPWRTGCAIVRKVSVPSNSIWQSRYANSSTETSGHLDDHGPHSWVMSDRLPASSSYGTAPRSLSRTLLWTAAGHFFPIRKARKNSRLHSRNLLSRWQLIRTRGSTII